MMAAKQLRTCFVCLLIVRRCRTVTVCRLVVESWPTRSGLIVQELVSAAGSFQTWRILSASASVSQRMALLFTIDTRLLTIPMVAQRDHDATGRSPAHRGESGQNVTGRQGVWAAIAFVGAFESRSFDGGPAWGTHVLVARRRHLGISKYSAEAAPSNFGAYEGICWSWKEMGV